MTYMSHFVVHSVAILTLAIVTSAGTAAPLPAEKNPDSTVLESIRTTEPIDINTATLKDLRSLPGIGPARAKKIVAGRPYRSVEDLKVRKVIPVKTYDRIRSHISARGSMKPTTKHDSKIQESSSGKN